MRLRRNRSREAGLEALRESVAHRADQLEAHAAKVTIALKRKHGSLVGAPGRAAG
jgi:hypothetical protein